MTPEAAFDRYEAIRHRLPDMRRPGAARSAAHLGDLAGEFDAVVFDAFGVLNVGERPIQGAAERVAMLRAAGKRLFVLTNAASYDRPATLAKFRGLGFDFTPAEIISSRDVCEAHLSRRAVSLWGVAAPPGFDPSELGVTNLPLGDARADYDRVDGVLLLSSAIWTEARQTLLEHSLRARPRPVVVANPDLVAPRETGLTLEPGYFAHALQDRLGIEAEYHGKPFPSVFEEIEGRLDGVPRARIAMIGDTLHTDVLGANARGWSSVLVSAHGLFAGLDVDAFIGRSGLSPDWIVPSI
ncbi:MAG: HAD-IIA family hydrolase [Ruegeria sp.]|uniref:HAD-IIA family hydrolase n=1 Tax=Ruegeria sp. TaxID=1879320 RepID=UPI00349E6FE3